MLGRVSFDPQRREGLPRNRGRIAKTYDICHHVSHTAHDWRPLWGHEVLERWHAILCATPQQCVHQYVEVKASDDIQSKRTAHIVSHQALADSHQSKLVSGCKILRVLFYLIQQLFFDRVIDLGFEFHLP